MKHPEPKRPKSVSVPTLDESQIDEVMRALCHPDRRVFVNACLQAPRAAGELAELSALALASVSEHLKVLRKSGLLTLEKDGRYRMYRTNTALLRKASRAIANLAVANLAITGSAAGSPSH